MDFFKAQLARLQKQLGGLTASQKMLAASLAVILVMTFFWWSLYAGKSATVSLLDMSLSPADINSITTYLDARAIPHQVTGDRIQVPSDKRYGILAGLQYAQLLPANTKDAFNEMFSKMGAWDSSAKTEKLWNVYRQTELAQIIREMPTVQSARVVLNPVERRGPHGTMPSASVSIQLERGLQPDEKLVRSVADFVSGAVANLKRSQVTVLVNDRSYVLADRETAGFGFDDHFSTLREHEAYYEEKLRQLFPDERVLVSVSAKLNTDRTETLEKKLDSEKVVHKPITEEITTDETQTAERNDEPGVVTNAGLSIAEGGGTSGSSSTMEKSRSTFELQVPTTEIKRFNAGGEVSVMSALVRIPRSHFIRAWKMRQPATEREKEPEDAVIEPFIAQLVSGYKKSVQHSLPLGTAEVVHVEAYPDAVAVSTFEPAAASLSLIVSDYYVKEIALGALALVSLFMVSTVVKRSSGTMPAAVAAGVSGPATLRGDEDPLGEAGEGAPLLDAVEMDADAVKTQEMLAQVGMMVNEHPDAAAAMIKRWLNR